MPSLAEKPSRRAPQPPTGSTPPAAWWGDGLAPHLRWPGVTIDIPVAWSSVRSRWESPDGRYFFDSVGADFAEGFFPTCLQHHIGNDWNGKPFDLMPYQRYVIRALFGWKRADGIRRFRKVFLAVPKGSGKSPFGAGVGLFLAFFDGEAGAEVYAVAADRQQAGIVFDSAKVFVQRNTTWDGKFDVYRDSIKAAGSTEYFQVLSSDASTKHGFRPHGIIFDEFHAQPKRDLFDTLYRGMGKRRQPVLMMITTAGDDDESICFEEWDYARNVISGVIEDPIYLPMVFEARDDEDWTQESTLRRVNPGYGITMKADYFETEVKAAQAEPRKRNSFLQLHCNRWVNQATSWLPIEWWDACDGEIPTDAELAKLPCAMGIDMSQKIDLTAAVTVFRLPLDSAAGESIEVVNVNDVGEPVRRRLSMNYRIAILPSFWLPEETLHERVHQDRVPYDIWHETKWRGSERLLDVTDGALIDSDAVVKRIGELTVRFPLLKQGEIGYDPAFATELGIRLRNMNLLATEIAQGFKLTEACQVLEALVKSKRVLHGGHRLLRWNVENVAIKRNDADGRIRPVKPRKTAKRIDGIVAVLIALSRLMMMPPPRQRTRSIASVWTPSGSFQPIGQPEQPPAR